MCDPVTMLTVASTAISAGGSVMQGNAARASADHNAKITEMNARIAERRALDAIDRGQKEELQLRERTAQLKGRQIAAMSAAGVDVNFGSPLDVLTDTAILGEIDALTIRRNAAGEARDMEMDASNKRASAAAMRAEGRNAQKAGYLDAFATVLGGASKISRPGGMSVPPRDPWKGLR